MKCVECNNANICLDHIRFPSLYGCTSGIPDHQITTNADRIRNMSDEELAEFMSENTSYYYCGVRCKDRPKSPTESSCFRWLEWLQSEAE